MTRPSGAHLSPDEIDSWLAGTLALEWQQHLDQCQTCLERVRTEREIVDQIAALPLMSPAADFSERVMASVVVPDPFAIRSLQATQRRLFATRKSVAVAATTSVVASALRPRARLAPFARKPRGVAVAVVSLPPPFSKASP